MKIKLARGPMANKRIQTDIESCYRYEVQEPVKKDWRYVDASSMNPYEMAFEYRRGHYERSNVTLKDGTVVFEWMGWRQ